MTGALLGILGGLLVGASVCARYLRQEIAANIAPRLRRIELQLDNLQTELTLAAAARAADLDRHHRPDLPSPPRNPVT